VQILNAIRLWVFFGKDGTVMMRSLEKLFKGRHFERDIIVVCVRWYLRYKLSFRDLVEMMEERGPALSHTTIMRWVQRFVPAFEKRWNRYARMTNKNPRGTGVFGSTLLVVAGARNHRELTTLQATC
jgi:hypothetical protein